MILKLERPLICFDLESTGLNISEARIVSCCFIKIYPDGSRETKKRLIHPSIKIPAESTLIHGITDDMVKDSPTFKNVSKGLVELISGCDLLSFNGNNYDVPLLAEEFLRCGIDFPEKGTRLIDACSIFKKMHERTLTAALRLYCNEELEGAHDAEADTDATIKVFMSQIENHSELQDKTIDEMHDFCRTDTRVDLAGTIVLDKDGDYSYNIGNNKGQKVKSDTSFAKWMLGKTFTMSTKKTLERILSEIENR